MIVAKPLRVFGMIMCVLMLVLPAALCFRDPHPHTSKTIEFIQTLFPFTLFVLVQLCIYEGITRERERVERKRRASEE